jgi:hypothetical protein
VSIGTDAGDALTGESRLDSLAIDGSFEQEMLDL